MEKIKILIADDERELVDMLAYNLQKKGYGIIKAHDGFEAWKKIESEKPDLLILDLMMPELDGWELCRLVRRNQNEEVHRLGILMLTARALPEDRVYGLELGADDYLTKPFSLSELMLRVENIVQKKRTIFSVHEEMDELRLKLRSKEETLRKMVHDLKTPILSMGASAKFLLRGYSHENKMQFLQNIYDNSLRLTKWVEDILHFYHLSSDGLKNEMRKVDIQSLVKEVIERVRGYGLEKEIEIHLFPSTSILSIQGHEPLLERTMENLISNAIKYTPNGGKIEVSVIAYLLNEGGGIVEISVKDTGIGISAEDLERIFEPFFRGKNAPSENGMGLGLAMVKEVIVLHGGKILVQSELNKGTTLSILLPLSENTKGKEVERI